MNYEAEIDQISTDVRRKKKAVETELKTMPEGRICFEKQGGRRVPVHEIRTRGKRYRHTISRDEGLQVKLLRKNMLLQELESLNAAEAALSQCRQDLRPFSLGKWTFDLQGKAPELPFELIREAIDTNPCDDWAGADYEKLDFLSGNKKHVTSRGLRVRSKSELLIAEKLYAENIAFRYEEVLHIEAATVSPDFTIRRADGKMFYWEHMGLTDSRDYISRQLVKLRQYALVNIVPWDNLIVTYDDSSGIIDLRIIESEIRNKLIC